ncbi:MAG TPA: hypothetical protein VLG40_05415 [Candidatus Saccharimonas sp.]|nr:hypothetical protein [Candidatus Saccharimonas sp.]
MHTYARFLGLGDISELDDIYVTTMAPLASIILRGAYDDCLTSLMPDVRHRLMRLVDERLEALWHDPSIFGLDGQDLWWLQLTSAQWERFVQAVYARYVVRRIDIVHDGVAQAAYLLTYRLRVSCQMALGHVHPAAIHYMHNTDG